MSTSNANCKTINPEPEQNPDSLGESKKTRLFGGKSAKSPTKISDFDSKIIQINPKSGDPNDLESRLNAFKQQDHDLNQQGIELMKDIITSQKGLLKCKHFIDESGKELDYAELIHNAFIVVSLYKNNKVINLTQAIKDEAKNHEDATESHLLKDIKPFLDRFGFWITSDKKTQWLSLDELKQLHIIYQNGEDESVINEPEKTNWINQQIQRFNEKRQAVRKAKLYKKARTDPYLIIEGDHIKKIPPPLTVDLTDSDKALIRKRDLLKARANIKAEIIDLKNTDHQKKMAEANHRHQALMLQQQHEAEMSANTALIQHRITRQQNWEQTKNGAIEWSKVALLLLAIGGAAWFINSQTLPNEALVQQSAEFSATELEEYQPW